MQYVAFFKCYSLLVMSDLVLFINSFISLHIVCFVFSPGFRNFSVGLTTTLRPTTSKLIFPCCSVLLTYPL